MGYFDPRHPDFHRRVRANVLRSTDHWRRSEGNARRFEERIMAYETKDFTGTLFKNDRRDTDSHPNAKGKALIAGRWYWMSAWTKEPRGGGDKYQSLSFEAMTQEQVEKYCGGQGSAPPQQRSNGGYGTRNDQAAGQHRPASRPGRAEQRSQPAPPFGEEQQFQEADIPF